MQLTPRYLRQFSLRSIFVAMTLIALFLGLHVSKVRQNKAAIRQLRARGAHLGCATMDPFGPDFMYTWNRHRIPNGYFNEWFEQYLCVEHEDFAFFEKTKVTPRDIQLLSNVPLVGGLEIRESQLEQETLATIGNLCRFKSLCFENTPLSDPDFSQLAKMTWLQQLFFIDASVRAEGIAKLRKDLPNCEIFLDWLR